MIKEKQHPMSTVIESTKRDILSPLQRWLEAAIVVGMLLLFAFLAYHQWANTGFFTSKFGVLEMICLYSPLFLALVAPLIRFWTGHRQPARPFEAADYLLLALGSLWLLIVFPFDFTHLADALPVSLRFILAWVSDDIGKLPLVIQVISGPIMAFSTIRTCLTINHQERDFGYRSQAL